ncbi:MAG TPA: hypothetical protein VGF97_04420 [Rhizomicrobium sp.]|jgi:hypothetical protein
MSDEHGASIALAFVGVLVGAFTIWPYRGGKSYCLNPPMTVSRADDPFSFWISIAKPGAVAILLLLGAAGGLLAILRS